MKELLGAGLMFFVGAAVLVALSGCGGTTAAPSSTAPQGGPPQVGPGPGGPPPGGGARGEFGRGDGGNSAIKQIMRALDKGPNSLNAIKQGLNADQPAWATIQPQTAEYAKLTADLVKADPPQKGSKESWAKLTAAYAASATELDKAAQANNLDAARVAHQKLERSCMECHREHRSGGRGGPGGPGGFGPGRRGPGGGPPAGG